MSGNCAQLTESDEHPADPSVTDHRRLIGGELSAEQEGDKHENNEEAIEESTSVRAKPTASHEANAERLREKGAARGGIAFLLQQMRSQVTTANPTKHVDPSASDVSAALPNSGRMTIKRKSDEESGAATLKAAKIDEINQESNASEASKFPEEVVEKQVMEIPKIKIEIAYGFADVVPGSSAYDVEPVQVVRDCFNRKTAPNFGFSRHVTENNYVRSCKWRPDGAVLCVESEDRRIRMFDYADGMLAHRSCSRFGDLIYDVQWHPHPDEDLCATTSKESPIHLWDSDGKLKASFRGINHLDELAFAYSMAFSLDGCTLYAGYYKTLRVFDVERPGRQAKELKTHVKGNLGSQKSILSCISVCPTMAGVYAVGCFGGTIGLYSDHTGSCDCLFGTEASGITQVVYSSDGNLLYSGYRKSTTIECFDLRFPGHVLSRFHRPAQTNQRFHFNLDSFDRFLFSGSSNGQLLIYDLKRPHPSAATTSSFMSQEATPPTWTVPVSDASVTGLSIHPSEPLVAVTTGERVFPPPLMDGSASSSDESADDDESTTMSSRNARGRRYALYGGGDLTSLDNSLKLFKI